VEGDPADGVVAVSLQFLAGLFHEFGEAGAAGCADTAVGIGNFAGQAS